MLNNHYLEARFHVGRTIIEVNSSHKLFHRKTREKAEKSRKNDNFFAIIQKITTFACLFGEKP